MLNTLVPVPQGELIVTELGDDSNCKLLGQGDHLIALSLIIPTFNESRNIEAMVKLVTTILDHHLQGRYELIVVDDNSPDRTWEIAQTTFDCTNRLGRILKDEQKKKDTIKNPLDMINQNNDRQ